MWDLLRRELINEKVDIWVSQLCFIFVQWVWVMICYSRSFLCFLIQPKPEIHLFAGAWVPPLSHMLLQICIWWWIKVTNLKWKLPHSRIAKIQLECDRPNQGHAASFSRQSTRHHAGKRFAWLAIHLHEFRLVLDSLSPCQCQVQEIWRLFSKADFFNGARNISLFNVTLEGHICYVKIRNEDEYLIFILTSSWILMNLVIPTLIFEHN